MRLLNGTGEWEIENENKEETTPTKNQIEVVLPLMEKLSGCRIEKDNYITFTKSER